MILKSVKSKKIDNYLVADKKILWNIWGKVCIAFFLLILVGCGTSKKINKNFLYFQTGLDSMESIQIKEIIIKNNDLLNIQIYSKSLIQDQAMIFNLPEKGGNSTNQGYTVGIDGNVDIPLLGPVKASGLTKVQLQNVLQEKLSSYIKDPFVVVKFSLFNINVLGEVRSPGIHSFQNEKVTILDAIGSAGDLTDFGKREDVMVIREDNSIRKHYQVDLRSGTLFLSPVFQLQPNDIVYVGANSRKLRTININPEGQKGLQTTSTILSMVSTLIFVFYTFFKIK